MHVKPDALVYAAGLIEREWGSSGYAIEEVYGYQNVAVLFVAHFDRSRFVIAAHGLTGQWGYADGDDDSAQSRAIKRMEQATYADGRWTWPTAAASI